MDSFELNKILGAVLAAAVFGMTVHFIARGLVSPHVPDELAYAVEIPDSGPAPAETEEPAGPEPIAPLLAAASVENGQSLAKKCTACHSFDQGGPNKVGPNLWDVVNRKIASVNGYSYSDALKEKSDEEWTYAHLNEFIWKPKVFASGTKMNFAGFKKPEERADMVVYLRSLSATPAPMPE